jgi:hypothetical protein
MSMDVRGKKPTAEAGVGIRYSIHGWHPLADYVCKVAPELRGMGRPPNDRPVSRLAMNSGN